MKVQCENCGVKLNLPDDKLEPGTDFSFNCPKCSTKNTVRIPGQSSATAQSAPPSQPAFDAENDEDAAMDEFFEEGAKPALICFDEGPTRDNLARIAEDLGFVPVLPTSTRDALKRIQITKFHMILLHDRYDGQDLDRNALLRLIQPMEMPVRRRIYVAVFSEAVHTFDQMAAYGLSVNTVVNTSDEPKFHKILERGLAEYRRFYKVYFEVMKEIGKL